MSEVVIHSHRLWNDECKLLDVLRVRYPGSWLKIPLCVAQHPEQHQGNANIYVGIPVDID